MTRASLRDIPVLALGTGITLLGVLRILGEDGAQVLALPDADPTTRHSRWFHPAPAALAGLTPDRLAGALSQVAEGTVLMPCSDAWVLAVAGLPESLRQRFPACVAPAEAIATLVDKARFRAVLERLALPHPRTRALAGLGEFDALPDAALASAFLKPADSQGFFARFRVKAFPVAGREETRRHLAECVESGFAMMLQEYIPGPPTSHYFVDGFVDRSGVVRARFARQRLRMFPADFGNSTLMVSVPPEQVADALRTLDALLADLHYRGIFSAEFKRDARDGRFNLIEVNARPWWYVEYAARCGVDVCALAVQDALGRPVTTIERYALGRRCAYPSYDWSAVREAHVGLGAALRDWLGAVQPVFKWNDPRPSLHEAAGTLRRRLA